MNQPRILILGGYGNTGRLLAQLLLAETQACLVLAGRDIHKAEKAASELNNLSGALRVTGMRVDAASSADLHKSFQAVDIVVVASSTAAYAYQVASAALEAGIDYLDVQYSTQKIATLQSMVEDIKAAGLCFITDGGFHPGLPAAMVRLAASRFDQMETAEVGSVIKIDWAELDFSPETMREFVGEFMDFQTLAYRHGEWRQVSALSMIKPEWMEFAHGFGRQYCIPMFLEEMRPIPEMYPHLQETGFYVGGFNWFVDWILSPLIMLVLNVAPEKGLESMSRMMVWGLRSFTKPPYGTVLKLETQGVKDRQPQRFEMSVYHQDGYMLTAIPVAACLLQYLDGSIRKPGLWFQALLVDPERFMADIKRLGAEVEIR